MSHLVTSLILKRPQIICVLIRNTHYIKYLLFNMPYLLDNILLLLGNYCKLYGLYEEVLLGKNKLKWLISSFRFIIHSSVEIPRVNSILHFVWQSTGKPLRWKYQSSTNILTSLEMVQNQPTLSFVKIKYLYSIVRNKCRPYVY